MTDWPPLRDYARSFAVLVGTWEYEFLGGRVPAAEHSLRRMERLLTGRLCGWPPDRMMVVPNAPSPGDLPDQLMTVFEGITDAALFYFVGHGQTAPQDELCMCLTKSRPEYHRRAPTSLRFTDVRQALRNSTAATKIVMLDCCFAGLATDAPTLAGDDVPDLTAGTGAYTMAATHRYGTAWYEDDPGLTEPQTYFTKYLADLVEHGIPGQPTQLRLGPLFSQLLDNLTADGRPVPHRRAVDDARDFVFAYNAAPPATHHDPERELVLLGQQLAETENRRAAADALVTALQAEAAERARELARLKEQLATARLRDTGEQRELQDAIDEAARQLDQTRAAQAAAVAAAPPSPLTEDLETLHPENQQTARLRGDLPARPAQPGKTHRRFLSRRKANAHKSGGKRSDDLGTPGAETDDPTTRPITQSVLVGIRSAIRHVPRVVHVRWHRIGLIRATGALMAGLAISLPFLFGTVAHQPPSRGPHALGSHHSSAAAGVGGMASSSDPGHASPTAGRHSQSPQATPSSNIAPIGPTAVPASSSPGSPSSPATSSHPATSSSPTSPSSYATSSNPMSSKSPQLADIPSTIGMTLTQATETLQSAGFAVKVVRVSTGAGNVTHYFPVGQAPRGTTVTIYC